MAKTGSSSSDRPASKTQPWLRLCLEVEPCPCPRPRVGRWGAYYPAKYVKWGKNFTDILRGVVEDRKISPSIVPLEVSISCFATKPRTSKLAYPRPDVDNLAKSVLDASNGILWQDDTLIVDLRVTKAWAPPKCPPQIIILIRPFSDTNRVRPVDLETI